MNINCGKKIIKVCVCERESDWEKWNDWVHCAFCHLPCSTLTCSFLSLWKQQVLLHSCSSHKHWKACLIVFTLHVVHISTNRILQQQDMRRTAEVLVDCTLRHPKFKQSNKDVGGTLGQTTEVCFFATDMHIHD